MHGLSAWLCQGWQLLVVLDTWDTERGWKASGFKSSEPGQSMGSTCSDLAISQTFSVSLLCACWALLVRQLLCLPLTELRVLGLGTSKYVLFLGQKVASSLRCLPHREGEEEDSSAGRRKGLSGRKSRGGKLGLVSAVRGWGLQGCTCRVRLGMSAPGGQES